MAPFTQSQASYFVLNVGYGLHAEWLTQGVESTVVYTVAPMPGRSSYFGCMRHSDKHQPAQAQIVEGHSCALHVGGFQAGLDSMQSIQLSSQT